MKNKVFAAVVASCIAFGSVTLVSAWGAWGHAKINRGAVLALPREMGMFFYNHADFITEESGIPDVRKHTLNDKAEGPRHYIDLERFNYSGSNDMPRTMEAAIKKYGADTLQKYGILPWYIEDMMVKLTTAFKNKNKDEILFLAADLGHYIGDAHMPLHTSVNHNGQLTGQEGVHAFWEAQLPELFGKNYSLNTANAQYIPDIEKATWDMIDSTHALVYTLLHTEKKMRTDSPEDKTYAMGANHQPLKNKYGQPVFSYEYAHVYHELLNGMVENQLRGAIKSTADYWYTAWVNAGKPDLSDLDPAYLTDRNKAFYREDIKLWKTGKVTGFKPGKEY